MIPAKTIPIFVAEGEFPEVIDGGGEFQKTYT